MAVGKTIVVALLQPRLVIHATAPARAPIGSVAPGAMLLEPQVIRQQWVEHLGKTIRVARLQVILPFCPRHNIGAGGGGIVPCEHFSGAFFKQLTANKAILVLVMIKIVQGVLEIEYARCIFSEHNNKGGIPHEQVAMKGGVDVV